MPLLKKILFLIKSNANLSVILVFLKIKLLNIFNKKKKKLAISENINFLKEMVITHDYFSSNAYFFYQILKNFNQFKYLEIGSFEGNSAMFVARKFPNSKIYCVDNWYGTEEYENLNFTIIEKNFDKNISEFKNISKIKNLSDNFFKSNQIKFDVIYVDGYHKASQAYRDFKNSWNFLVTGGIIILDDYIWHFFLDIKDNPCFAINKFLREISGKFKILIVSNSQIFIKKTSA